MAYVLRMSADIAWVGDGCGPMSVPSAQRLKEVVVPATPVPGADAPSSANITSACNTAAVALAALFNANLTQIQGFATGGN